MNFPPAAVLPPFGTAADLLWLTEQPTLALEHSVFFSVCAVDELLLLLLVGCVLSNSAKDVVYTTCAQ